MIGTVAFVDPPIGSTDHLIHFSRVDGDSALELAYDLKSNGQWKLAQRTVNKKATRPLEAVRRQKQGAQRQLQLTEGE